MNTTQNFAVPETLDREFWTVPEVARRLGVAPFTVRRLCWAGKLRVTRIGSLVRISEQELQRFIADQTTSAPSAQAGVSPGGNAG